MTIRKRKKITRQRGSSGHGWGEKKKHRGAGHRGGRGRAGSGKRADQKKPSYWKEPTGKSGFIKKGQVKSLHAINIRTIEQQLTSWLTEKRIVEKEGTYVIELETLGYNKVLGYGKVTKKLVITAPYFSKGAAEKIQEAGGKALTPDKSA